MGYSADKTAYNAAINAAITTQTAPNTIPPEEVGGGYTDLANLLEPYINAINNQSLLFGTAVPSSGLGTDLDLYFRQGNPIMIYRKTAGSWILQGSLPLGFTLPDGNLTVQTSIADFTASASAGGWVISGTVYNSTTQTQLTLDAADVNYYRHDNLYATTAGTILYQAGTATASPVAPTLPANTILIDTAIVPSVSSGFAPYLQNGGNGNDLLHRSGNETKTGQLTFDDGGGATNAISASELHLNDGADDAFLTAGGLTVNSGTDSVGINSGSVQVTDGTNGVTVTSGYINLADGTNGLDITATSLAFTGLYSSYLTTDTVTAGRTWTLPDASGPLAVIGAGNVTDATHGAFSIKRGSAADTDAIFQGLNGAGTVTFSLTGNGSVAIGTANPVNRLTIFDNTTTDSVYGRTSSVLRNENPTMGNGTSTFNVANQWVQAGNGAVSLGLEARYDSGLTWGGVFTKTNHDLVLGTNNVFKVIITTAGNVGVGTTTPLNALTLNAASGANMGLRAADVDDWVFGENAGEGTRNFNVYNYNTGGINLSISRTTGFIGVDVVSASANERLTQNGRHAFNATTVASATSGQAKLWSQTVSSVTDLYAMNSAGTSGKVAMCQDFSQTIDFPSIAANSNNTQPITISGTTVGDFPILSYDATGDHAGIVFKVRHTGASTCSIEAFNLTGSAIDLPSTTFYLRFIKK